MTTARRSAIGMIGLLITVGLAGCQQKDLEIQALQERVQALQRENDDLRARLTRAMSERDAARAEANSLRQQLDALKGQPKTEGPPGWQFSGPFAWYPLPTDFLFDSGKATLRPQARAKLQEVVNTIQTTAQFAGMDILVLGHTDTDPIVRTKALWKDNLDLSSNRAMTVYRELMQLGLRPQIMMAAGQGEWKPVADNKTRAGRQENRRVEVILMPHRGPAETPGTSPKIEAPPGEPQIGS